MKKKISWKTFTAAFVAALALCLACPAAFAVKDKPNILLIMSDDVGITNISAYSDGLVGYRTPNIDRIANEGMRFTDYYAEQSCTAGRSAFVTGQSPVRTGLTKVGMPGADLGLRAEDPRRSPNCSSRTAT
jgi:arylsulfatase